MEWISVKDRLPESKEFVLAYNHIHGVGVAFFHVFHESLRKELEDEFKDKYICTCHFIKSKLDGNRCIDDENDIDIFEHSPHFYNLGTITHWMPLPEPPLSEQIRP